jgi:hypothetical protein
MEWGRQEVGGEDLGGDVGGKQRTAGGRHVGSPEAGHLRPFLVGELDEVKVAVFGCGRSQGRNLAMECGELLRVRGDCGFEVVRGVGVPGVDDFGGTPVDLTLEDA